jgi:hypothetical protein
MHSDRPAASVTLSTGRAVFNALLAPEFGVEEFKQVVVDANGETKVAHGCFGVR